MKKIFCFFCLLILVIISGNGCVDSTTEPKSSSWLGTPNTDKDVQYKLKIEAPRTVLGVEQTIPLLIRLTGYGAAPIKETEITLVSSNGGEFDGDFETDFDGYVRASFTAETTAGSTSITASALGVITSLALQVQPIPLKLADVNVFIASEVIKPMQSMPIQVFVSDSSGVGQDRVEILLSALSDDASFAEETGLTDEGWFSTFYTAPTKECQETINALSLGKVGSKTFAIRE